MASRKDERKSQDMVFSFAALAISQNVFGEDFHRLFTVCKLELRQPDVEVDRYKDKKKELKHPSDKPAWGQHHRVMNTHVLSSALRLLSRRLGLAFDVSTRTFRTSYGFKNVLKGKIPGWRLAQRMGHTSGDKNLQRFDYAPTHQAVDTRRTGADPDSVAAFSDGVRAALKSNGSVMHLADPADIDPDALQSACTLLERLNAFVEIIEKDGNVDIPDSITDGIVNLFQSINMGVKAPFDQSLTGLLSLTSAGIMPWTSLVQQPHPFEDESVCQGSDGKLLAWILRGGSQQCPSCNQSFHVEQLKGTRTKPSESFMVYNDCLTKVHQKFCCFVCGDLFPLDDGTHAVECFQKRYDAIPANRLTFDKICVVYTRSFQQWRHATYHA